MTDQADNGGERHPKQTQAPEVSGKNGALPAWYPRAVAITLALVLIGLGLLWFLDVVSSVLYILVLSLFVSFALEPSVNWLAERGWRRGVATGAVMVALIAVGVVVLLVVLPSVVNELIRFFTALPDYIRRGADALNIDVSTKDLNDQQIATFRASLVEFGSHLIGGVVQVTAGFVGFVGMLFTIGLIAFYLVAEGPRFRRAVCSLLPRERQVEVLRIWEISIKKMGGYLYSRLVLAICSGVGVYIILRLLGLPYASSLAIWQGVVSAFIPIVGTYIALALPLLVALLEGSNTAAVILVMYELAYQQFENYVLSPRISAKTMDLHPAVAFVTALLGGAIGGLLGAFLALPVGAIFQAVGSTIIRRHEVVEDALTRELLPTDARAEREASDEEGSTWGRLRRWVKDVAE